MKKSILLLSFFLFNLAAHAQEGFIGEVKLFAGDFAPRNWAFCDGQLLSIAQNQALFSILGAKFGGDGRTTFGLPKLDDAGTAKPMLYEKSVSKAGGVQVSFTATNNSSAPIDMYWVSFTGVRKFYATIQPGTTVTQVSAENHIWHFLNGTNLIETIQLSNQATQAYTLNAAAQGKLRYIICVNGVFPSRN